MAWVREAKGRALFLFLHYYDVHSDYASRPEHEAEFLRPYEGIADGTTTQLAAFREGRIALSAADAPNLVDRYDAGIRQMDAELGRFFDFLRAEGLWEEAIVVITSDHGEEFLEHGGVLHGQTQYQEVLRIPLLMKDGRVPKGKRVRIPVSLVDIAPTLLARTGVAAPSELDGADLAPLCVDEGRDLADRYLFSEADHNNVEHNITRSVRHRNFKLHFNRLSREYRLFDLERDPAEERDLSASQANAVAALSERLEAFMARKGVEAPVRALSEEEIEKLRSLGYLR
jgi:arylsulfatase A-like enzyme